MDSRRESIVVLLSTFMVMKYVIVGILALQKVAIFEQKVHMMMMAVYIAQGWRVNSQRRCWKFQRYGGFLEQMLLGSYSNGDFQKRMRVSTSTFQYLSTLLGLVLKKKDTHFRESISMECRIAIILSRLASRNFITNDW